MPRRRGARTTAPGRGGGPVTRAAATASPITIQPYVLPRGRGRGRGQTPSSSVPRGDPDTETPEATITLSMDQLLSIIRTEVGAAAAVTQGDQPASQGSIVSYLLYVCVPPSCAHLLLHNLHASCFSLRLLCSGLS